MAGLLERGLWPSLPDYLYEVARLHWIEGLGDSAIAIELGMKRAAVRQRIAEAKKYLDDEGEEVNGSF
jgi:DNA-directed RNA polymerase specialized sigma24 family protein